jgi:acyl-CoA thioesterase-1
MPPDGDLGNALIRMARFVALGDSYTIGTSVGAAERWPDQLVARLGGALQLVANLGVNGYTSRDVVEDELPRLDELEVEFASLLVGVNDVVQGVPADRYRRDATTILDHLAARLPASRILAVSTPDYTVTPRGGFFGDPAQQRAGIVQNNGILRELAEARGIAFVEIFDISSRAAIDRTLVAGDGLHPSGLQYGLWVDRIEPVVRELLAREGSAN